jgi:hypothetical protein
MLCNDRQFVRVENITSGLPSTDVSRGLVHEVTSVGTTSPLTDAHALGLAVCQRPGRGHEV